MINEALTLLSPYFPFFFFHSSSFTWWSFTWWSFVWWSFVWRMNYCFTFQIILSSFQFEPRFNNPLFHLSFLLVLILISLSFFVILIVIKGEKCETKRERERKVLPSIWWKIWNANYTYNFSRINGDPWTLIFLFPFLRFFSSLSSDTHNFWKIFLSCKTCLLNFFQKSKILCQVERERKQESSDKECEPLNRERSSFSIFKSERSRFEKGRERKNLE